jgi:hypothetical protein
MPLRGSWGSATLGEDCHLIPSLPLQKRLPRPMKNVLLLALAGSGLLLFGSQNTSKMEVPASELYRVCWQDAAVLQGLLRYIKAHGLQPQTSCLTVASMPVRGGKCTYIAHLAVHPQVNDNYPDYWFKAAGYLVLVYDPVFKSLCHEDQLRREVDAQLRLNHTHLVMHPAISEPVSLRVLERSNSVTYTTTDFYPELK